MDLTQFTLNITLLIQGSNLGLRFVITLFFVSLIIALAHTKGAVTKQNTYTYFVISIVVFFLCFTLNTLDLNLGMALGLFAIFGIIRYRTETIRTEDMTYLFAFIGLSVINALTPFGKFYELVLINIIITTCIGLAQQVLLTRKPASNPNQELQRTIFSLPMGDDLRGMENELKTRFEKQYQKKVKRIELSRIDEFKQQITFIIFH